MRPKPKDEGERAARIRPGRVRRANTSTRPITGTARNLLRLTRLVSRSQKTTVSRSGSSAERTTKSGSPFQRRCVVNVRYANGRTPGGWRAHGIYVERESAKGDARFKGDPSREREHSGSEDRLGLAKERSLASLADAWQKAGDKRIFKIILSPEDASADFAKTANAVISRIEEHSGGPLEWGGVVHHNTDHPHAHLLVRGRVRTDEPLKLPPAMIRRGLREAAQTALTRQLGPRTLEEIQQQQRAELTANRVISFDQKMVQRSPIYTKDPAFLVAGTNIATAERTRLRHLEKLGLAKYDLRDGWLVRADAMSQLRQMKDIQDRARILFRSGVAISDPHAPMEYSVGAKKLIGRVLLNSEDERTGALQTIFETTEGKVEILRHDGTLRAAWIRGDLAPGNIVTIDSLRSDPSKLYASSVGMDREILTDKSALDSLARRMRTMGLVATEGKGWMGELSRTLTSRALERQRERGY
jgi:hypothetical protein